MKLSHDELASSLARHLMQDNRMVWEDIPVGCSGSIRPDVLTIEKSFANPNPISYEIKVSVSDFRSDVTSGKWMGYLDFSSAVVFAVPKGLITKNDLPNGCGLMTFNGEFWNTVKRPTLSPSNLNNELLLKLLISGNERQTNKYQVKNRDFNEHEHHEKLRKKFGDDLRSKLYFLSGYEKRKQELAGLKDELINILDLNIDNEKWSVERDIKYAIGEIRKNTDKSLMKKSVAKEIAELQASVSKQMARFIEEYTKE